MGWEETSKYPRIKNQELWINILQKEREENSFFYRILVYIYTNKRLDSFETNSTEIGAFFHCSRQKIEATVRSFSKKLIKENVIEVQFNDEGQKRYWNVPFLGRRGNPHFIYILRKEVINALSVLRKTDSPLDDDIDEQLEIYKSDSLRQQAPLSAEESKKAANRPLVYEDHTQHKIKKNIRYTKSALVSANFKCQAGSHETFLTNLGVPYMEGHHLIPCTPSNAILFLDKYNFNLDCPQNIVCLCPTCHRAVHFGSPAVRNAILHKLYSQQKEKLLECGVDLSFELLLSFYQD